MPEKVTLFFDSISPYSWFAFEILCRYQPVWGVEVDFVPFLLSGIMQASENQPPGFNRFKGRYMASDLVRNGKLFGVPLTRIPREFPVNTLRAQRLLTYVKAHEPSKLAPASLALWRAYWGDSNSIDKEDVLVQYLTPVLGAEMTQAFIAASFTDATTKQKLIQETKRATDIGAFGAPWIVVEREVDGKPVVESFFGSDRLENIALMLGKPYYGPNPGAASKL
ncbi:hypothetical protein HK105_201128 [Polyrhizophydium stewartii]|uniref:Glutathione S-transferase kappa n=1 Tax=Polyrhizophydium stewartii TaxID=2732419 RepID=A0ABR4NIZ5_9FUNG|nr:Glutathione S-transferase kappa 1 [Polyrhizophydium stewartii]